MKHAWRSTVTDAAIALVCGAIVLTTAAGVTERRQTAATSAPYILIDAGHGGEDGGAVAADGTVEKEINLAVALPLRDLLSVMGFSVVMTRETDTMLHGGEATLRERKVADMKRRLDMVQTARLTVSLHQNKFEQTKYSGTQVFYSPNAPESREIAQAIQETVVSLLQPHNTRPLKAGDSTVYLLHRATAPIVLVECGFLSNKAECEKLKTRAYQRQMAFAVAGGVMKGLA